MKGNKTDNLFRNKLKGHTIAPPPTAWDKIESQLPNPSKKGIYFGIAAAMLVILTFSWIILSNRNSGEIVGNSHQTAMQKPKKSPLEIRKEESSAREITTPTVSRQPTITNTKPAIKGKSSVSNSVVLERKSTPFDDNPSLVEQKEIAVILPEMARLPKFSIVKQTMQKNFVRNFSVDMEDFIAGHFTKVAPSFDGKKFRLLNSITSVVKSVNNVNLTFSAIRKSKNDFFKHNLKYGSIPPEEKDEE